MGFSKSSKSARVVLGVHCVQIKKQGQISSSPTTENPLVGKYFDLLAMTFFNIIFHHLFVFFREAQSDRDLRSIVETSPEEEIQRTVMTVAAAVDVVAMCGITEGHKDFLETTTIVAAATIFLKTTIDVTIIVSFAFFQFFSPFFF
jgi:hypothetical protein